MASSRADDDVDTDAADGIDSVRKLQQEKAELQQKYEKIQQEKAEFQQKIAELQEKGAESERRFRPTSFQGYLELCHTHLATKLRVEERSSRRTRGTTKQENKCCPSVIRPWDGDLCQEHDRIFNLVLGLLPSTALHFKDANYVESLSQEISTRPLSSEKDLEIYHSIAIESPVKNILNQLLKNEVAREAFSFMTPGTVTFVNHMNGVTHIGSTIQRGDPGEVVVGPSDLIGAICEENATEENAAGRPFTIIELKPPYKLSADVLSAGLSRADQEGSIRVEDVINNPKIPNETTSNRTNPTPSKKFMQQSEYGVCEVMTQAYQYMLHGGLRYGGISTAKSFVMLEIKESDPHTLYYHVWTPGNSPMDIRFSFVSVVLTACIMALSSEPFNERWRKDAIERANRFKKDSKSILAQMTPNAEEEVASAIGPIRTEKE